MEICSIFWPSKRIPVLPLTSSDGYNIQKYVQNFGQTIAKESQYCPSIRSQHWVEITYGTMLKYLHKQLQKNQDPRFLLEAMGRLGHDVS
jgi:hypothetical protein